MELTRRDALVALAGGVTASAVVGSATERLGGSPDASLNDVYIEHLRAVATVVYPAEVNATREFIETYVLGRIAEREGYRDGMIDALDALVSASRQRYGKPVTAISESDLNRLLREMGVGTAYPVPNGTVPERIRYYVVNDLLYALYTTPMGGRLVGYENPDGYPGGTEAYQRGPDE